MMKVLITAASKHGATAEIAMAIARGLSGAGVETVVRPPEQVRSLEEFDAVVLGSGVYAGRWLASAKRLIEEQQRALTERPVWLFSSGPLGNPPKPEEDPADVAVIRGKIPARDHRVFPGRVDKRQLSLAERAIIAVVKAPEGDFRRLPDAEAWGATIARELSAPTTVS